MIFGAGSIPLAHLNHIERVASHNCLVIPNAGSLDRSAAPEEDRVRDEDSVN
jgi:hypothetical protein